MTLNLISANVYNSVKGPSNRSFGLIEVFFIGLQLPILVALIEYGFLLYTKRYYEPKPELFVKVSPKGLKEDRKKPFDIERFCKTLDKAFVVVSIIYILLFNCIYWSTVFLLLTVEK